MTQQSTTSRRPLRDVAPATLAAGAAGLVVTLLVGGTTAGIQSALGPGVERLPGMASGVVDAGQWALPSSRGNAGVTVRVRPARPATPSPLSVFDLAPAASEVAIGARPSSVPRPALAAASAAAAVPETTAVPAPPSPITAAPAPAEASAPVLTVVVKAPRSESPKAKRKATSVVTLSAARAGAGRARGAMGDDDGLVVAASASPKRAKVRDEDKADGKADDRDDRRGVDRKGPPAHAASHRRVD